MKFVKRFYSEVLGEAVDCPDSFAEILDGLFEVTKPYEEYPEVLTPKAEPTEAGKRFQKLLIPHCMLGKRIFLPGDAIQNENRALDQLEEYFTPGDVLATMDGESTLSVKDPADVAVHIYLGGGKVLSHTAAGTQIAEFDDTFAVASGKNAAFLFRPYEYGN